MIKSVALRFLCCLAVVAGLAMSVGAVQAKSLDDILKAGVIRIGINPNFPPSSSRDESGKWVGFDIEIGNKIAEALKVKVEWVPTETKDRVPFLVADTIDLSLGALTRNSERAKLIEYTVPLHTEVLAVLTTEKVAATKWQDLNKSDITFSHIRSSWVVDWQKKNMSNAKQEIVDTIPDVVRMVAQGRADAIVENIDFFMAHTKSHPEREVAGSQGSDLCRLLRNRRQQRQLRPARCAEHHSVRPALVEHGQRALGKVVRRTDAGEGRSQPVLLIANAVQTRTHGSRVRVCLSPSC